MGIVYQDEARSKYHIQLGSSDGAFQVTDQLGIIRFPTSNVFNIDPKYTNALIFVKSLIFQSESVITVPVVNIHIPSATLLNKVNATLETDRFQSSKLLTFLLPSTTTDFIEKTYDGNAKENGFYCASTIINNDIIIEIRDATGALYTTAGNYIINLEVQLICNENLIK